MTREEKRNQLGINPVAWYNEIGPEKMLVAMMDERVEIEALQAMARAARFDPSGKAYRWKDRKRLAEYIVKRAGERLHRGDVFLYYQG